VIEVKNAALKMFAEKNRWSKHETGGTLWVWESDPRESPAQFAQDALDYTGS
jgi:hypothetical protein